MSRVKRAVLISDELGIGYAHALRLLRAVHADHEMGAMMDLPDLIHACRELKEKQEKMRKARRPRGVLPKGAGRVNCTSSDKCDATAAADGKGSPIVLIHDDGCPDKYPINDHAYDVGHDREEGKPCIAIVADQAFWAEDALCGRPLSDHAYSKYPEDGR